MLVAKVCLQILISKADNVFMNTGKTPKQNLITVKEAATILGISDATVRNWVRLSKLSAAGTSPCMLKREDVLKLHSELDNSQYLKARRNKSRVTTNFIPKSYIDPESPNYKTILKLIESLEKSDISFNLYALLSAYAKAFMDIRKIPGSIKQVLLRGLKPDAESAYLTADSIDLCESFKLAYAPLEDTLGMLYLSLRSLRDKKSTGSYYTPYYVSRQIIEDLPSDCLSFGKRTVDPSCGTGNFLLQLPYEISIENIYGFDIDPTAIAIARINVALKYSIQTGHDLDVILANITCRDFLMTDNSGLKPSDGKFNVIIGNPPWGYHYDQKLSCKLSADYYSALGSKMPESFSLFIEKALGLLAKDGFLSFLLPESILEATTHGPIREFILNHSHVCSITYLGDVFDKVQCPCIILALGNTKDKESKISVSFGHYKKGVLTAKKTFTAAHSRLDSSSFQLLCDDEQFGIITKMDSSDHFTLKGKSVFALGIVTGSNKTLLKEKAGPGLEPIIKGKNIEKYNISGIKSFIHYEPLAFQQCAPTKIYRSGQKLFYRFISDAPVFAIDTERMLSLNSANILIPDIAGYDIYYILALLNSSVLSFYYKKSFKSLKVLRSNLEALPLAHCNEETQNNIVKLSRQLSDEYSDKTYLQLDKMIASLYGISDEEYEVIADMGK